MPLRVERWSAKSLQGSEGDTCSKVTNELREWVEWSQLNPPNANGLRAMMERRERRRVTNVASTSLTARRNTSDKAPEVGQRLKHEETKHVGARPGTIEMGDAASFSCSKSTESSCGLFETPEDALHEERRIASRHRL